MATKIGRIGYGQVEPNHLSAQRTGQIYAQLPAADTISILENGQFVKYDYAKGVVDFDVNPSGGGKKKTTGEWMMVFNEVKLYDDPWRESYKDFAMIKENYTPGSSSISHGGLGPFKGQMVPRVIKINIGDIYTTNAVGANNTGNKVKYEGIDVEVGDNLVINGTSGFLVVNNTPPADIVLFQVVKITTMPDGQPAIKVMRIQ